MDTGVAIFPTHDAIAPAEVARLDPRRRMTIPRERVETMKAIWAEGGE